MRRRGEQEGRQRAGREIYEVSPMRGTVHRTCLYSVKTKKFFLGCEEPRKIFLRAAPPRPVLTLYKRPVCCVDTQLASELLSADFLFWEPGAGPERGAT